VNEPERLIDLDPEARELLRAGRAEAPSAAAAARLHAALGLKPLLAPLLATKWLAMGAVVAITGYGVFATEPAANTAPANTAPASAAPASASASRVEDPLVDELRRLEGARARMRASAPAQALALLDAYDARHARGTLREEALALRIDTLVALDRVGAARELARVFLRTYPSSVHRLHVQAQLDDAH
jgi:hypothetical protein